VLVAGISGAGKTTLASRVAEITGGAHTELDSLFHGPDWTPREQFMADVEAFSAASSWTTEWLYRASRPLLGSRADLMVWLDLPFTTVVLPRVVRRTVRRWRRHEVLWNGNVEPPLRTIFTNRDHIIRWSIRTRRSTADNLAALVGTRPDLVVVHLRSQREADQWLVGPLRSACARDD
jgi:adenylate kinase family enzyme